MPKTSTRAAAGFGLVEIMVALVIGMLAVIVMLQVFALSEDRKRTTTGSGDALGNGAIIFNQLQSDISQAGYGLVTTNLFNCPLSWSVGASSIGTPVNIAPVTVFTGTAGTNIIPAGDANTDRLLVMYGNTNEQPEGQIISSSAGASTVYTVNMPSAFSAAAANAPADRVIAAPTACSANLVIDTVTATSTTTVTFAGGAAGAALYNLGPNPTVLAYAVRNARLTVCDYMTNDCGRAADKDNPSVWVPIAANVVSLRALYGRDTLSPVRTQAQIDAFATRPNYAVDGYDAAQPATACAWARVPAISLALVARNAQFSRDEVTSAAPGWSQSAKAPIDLSGDPQWKHYRYKVFEAVVPIRNVAWMGVQAGC